jgi:hypothetical protein
MDGCDCRSQTSGRLYQIALTDRSWASPVLTMCLSPTTSSYVIIINIDIIIIIII